MVLTTQDRKGVNTEAVTGHRSHEAKPPFSTGNFLGAAQYPCDILGSLASLLSEQTIVRPPHSLSVFQISRH